MNWAEFFAMGGYAFEVWLSWGLTLITVIAFIIWPKLRMRQTLKQVARQAQRQARHNAESTTDRDNANIVS
ncbi:hypothetical protein GCM10008090_09600 [Arenicella chitinivorans]|uniref:Heme exporter protein D n=1 Tax=Arenicella chitinivorans TaxID=1329800 RepID=A0A918RMI8_9GAMM|nr:heme exporter protein CcmD [Arenicella chitinivorans]GHA02365.1 hypothetical protein GCM10008090_09600 [Arenicella chitinivorans]